MTQTRSECHLCRDSIEQSQLLCCMRCGAVLCKECFIDHASECVSAAIANCDGHFPNETVAEIRGGGWINSVLFTNRRLSS